MNTDEQIFDFLAAAEDTGKQLDDLIKSIPGEVRETLADEYQKSPWLTALPATADRVTAAAERAESAANVLSKKAIFAGVAVCLAAVDMGVCILADVEITERTGCNHRRECSLAGAGGGVDG